MTRDHLAGGKKSVASKKGVGAIISDGEAAHLWSKKIGRNVCWKAVYRRRYTPPLEREGRIVVCEICI